MSSVPAALTANEPKITLKYRIAVMQASGEGHPVQVRYANIAKATWRDAEFPDWNWSLSEYRIKPSQVLRAWDVHEVPVGALVRSLPHKDIHESQLHKYLAIIVERQHHGVRIGAHVEFVSFEYCKGYYEHSTDGGKTWLPCGTYEA